MSAGHSRRDVFGYAFSGVAYSGFACSGFSCADLVTPVAEAAAITLPDPEPWEECFLGKYHDLTGWVATGDYHRLVQNQPEEFFHTGGSRDKVLRICRRIAEMLPPVVAEEVQETSSSVHPLSEFGCRDPDQ
jgi:hypothetical protein